MVNWLADYQLDSQCFGKIYIDRLCRLLSVFLSQSGVTTDCLGCSKAKFLPELDFGSEFDAP